jgi:hypothetical protein
METVSEVTGNTFTADEFLGRWQPTSTAHQKDEQESERVGRKVRAGVKQCWFNARKAILKVPEYAEASHVEGWACLPFPMEHGWIVRDGVIVDPTLPHDEGAYFPGLEFRGCSEIEAFLDTPPGRRCKKSPFFYAFGWGGMQSPSFRKCYEEAMEYCARQRSRFR